MKTPKYFAPLSELSRRDFKKNAVITPKHRFDFYDQGQQCHVLNWSSEYQTHIYHRLNFSDVDGKPLYFVDTYSMWGDWLCTESYRTITEVKKVWHGQL